MTTTWDSEASTPFITGQSWRQFGITVQLIHELTHVFTKSPNAGAYHHGHMAEAAQQASIMLGMDVKKGLGRAFPNMDDYAKPEDYYAALSHYYNDVVTYACRKVRL